MPTITLVPWDTYENFEPYGDPWAFSGASASCQRAVGDGNYAQHFAGQDSYSLRGIHWRVEGSGAVPSWANKVITSVLVQIRVTNLGNGNPGFDVTVGNEALSFVQNLFNGELPLAVNTPTFVTMFNGAHDAIKAAILADNFLSSVIHYDHLATGNNAQVDQTRVVVTYTENIPRTAPAMEF